MNCDWLSRPKVLNHSWLLYELGIQGTALAMQNKLSSFLRLFMTKEMQKKWSMYLFPRSLLMEWTETIVSVVRELVTTIIKTLQEWDEINLAEIRFTYQFFRNIVVLCWTSRTLILQTSRFEWSSHRKMERHFLLKTRIMRCWFLRATFA